MSVRNYRAAISLTATTAVLMMGASGSCVPGLVPFGKSSQATAPAVPVSGSSTVSQCPSFTAYQAEVEPAVQRLCISCHGSGGRGAGKLLFQAGDSSNTDVAANNFFVARNEAVPIGGSVDPSAPDTTSPFLERINGTVSHDLVLGQASQDYFSFYDWVSQELAQTCVIDPTTGTVTITATASPSTTTSP